MAICCALSPGSAGSCWAKGTSGPTRPAGQSASKTKTSIKCCFEKFLSVIFKICKSFMFAFLFRAFKEVTVYRGQRAIRSVLSTSFTWNELLYRKIGNYCFLFCCIRMYLPHLHFKVQCVTSTVFFLAFFQGPAGEIGPPGQQGNPGMQVLQFILSRQRSTVNTPDIKHTQSSHPLDPACSHKASLSRMHPLACMRTQCSNTTALPVFTSSRDT